MMWLLVAYLILIFVNFCMSVQNIESWAYRGHETNTQKVIRWICITIVNPVFTVMYWGCWIYVLYWQKKETKRRRKL